MAPTGGSAPVQGRLWGATARQRDRLHSGFMRPLWVEMLDACGVRAGSRFLDAGCGSGGACVLAAERGAHVFGLDASEEMISISREHVPLGEFKVGDLEEMPYPAGSFQAIVACNSVHFTATPENALKELRRVTAPGGLMAVACMGYPADMGAYELFQSLFALLEGPPPANPFRLSAPGVLDRMVAQAGFEVVAAKKVSCPVTYADFEQAYDTTRAIGSMNAVLEIAGEQKFRATVQEFFDRHHAEGGGYRFENLMRFVLGRA